MSLCPSSSPYCIQASQPPPQWGIPQFLWSLLPGPKIQQVQAHSGSCLSSDLDLWPRSALPQGEIAPPSHGTQKLDDGY